MYKNQKIAYIVPKKIIIIMSLIISFNIFTIIPTYAITDETGSSDTPSQSVDTTENPANTLQGRLDDFAGSNGAGYTATNNNTLENIVANVIKIILGFLGIIFLIFIILSGIQWMTAEGNDDAVKKAKTRMKNAVIGLIITLLAYTIQAFLFGAILYKLFQ